MELFDVYDIDRIPTGKFTDRNTHMTPGEFRLSIHVSIFNSLGQMLIQKRKSDDVHWAGLWDISVGGCALHGESSRQAAHRETLEELGLDIDFSCLRPFITVNHKYGFDDEYIVNLDADIEDISYQKDEIDDVKWADLDEVFAMIDRGEFMSYHKEFIGLMFKNAATTRRDVLIR